jgi:hypothetical protein
MATAVPSPPAATTVPSPPVATTPPAVSAEPSAAPLPLAPAVTPALAPLPEPAAPSPLEHARLQAQSVPCSVLNVADGPRVSGLAPAGPDLDRLLSDLRDIGPLTDDVGRVDRFTCAPIAAVARFVRQSWDAVPPAFALRPAASEVASGSRLGLDVTTTSPAFYIDVFQNDGSVRHVARPPRSGAAAVPHAEFTAGPGAGPALVVAIGSAVALDLGVRPEVEKAAAYLAVLGPRLQSASSAPSADVAIVTVRPAEAVAAKPGPAGLSGAKVHTGDQIVVKTPEIKRPAALRSSRCMNIINRVQLGETLSDEERAALRTECRS